jgi:hypothetical protein
MDPNRALVFMLQLRGDKLISRDLAQRQLPFEMNVTEEQQRIDVEELREALLQSMAAFAQSLPVLAEQGQDPSAVVQKLALVIAAVQAGTPVETAVSSAFAPPPTPPPGALTTDAGAPVPGAPAGSAPGGGPNFPPPGMNASGLPSGVAPGQAEQGPGGRPALMDLIAGLTGGGNANLGASVRRRMPAA